MKQEIKERIKKINNGVVPMGYRQTDFGIFPTKWIGKKFGNLFNFQRGLAKSRDELKDKGVCYLHYGDIHVSNKLIFSYDEYKSKPKADIKLLGDEKYILNDGDLVFVDASEDIEGTSRTVLVDNPDNKSFVSGLHTMVAKEIISNFAKEYKQYLCLPKYIKKQFAKYSVGFKVYGVNTQEIKHFVLYYPSATKEQLKIAKILMKWDEMVELQQSYIEKLEIRKKSLMQKLLTPKNSWKSCKLGEQAILYAGGTPSTSKRSYWDNGNIPWIQSGLIHDNYIDIKDITSRITADGLKHSSAQKIKANSVLIAITGATCGNIGYLLCDATANQSVIAITECKFNELFMFYYLQNCRNQLLSLQNGSAQGGLTLKYLQNFSIYVPSTIEEQKAIADILSKADEEIELNKEKLEKIKEQRKTLQQYLLTGIVRVKMDA